jgi:dsDNA-specific endonuclease/ATPase MutS2
MSDESYHLSIHVPAGLLALAVALFLVAQLASVSQGSKALGWQITSTETQITNLEDTEKQLLTLLSEREALVKQADQVKGQYVALLNDVLELAKTDEDARKIVEKWNIRQQAPAADKAATPAE